MHRFSISDIEIFTGIKAHTLRIWEQRYGIFKAKRTSTNIRYYDDEDLKLLLNISLLNDEGERISSIAKLNRDEINRRVEEIALRSNDSGIHFKALISAMLDLDEAAFGRVLNNLIDQRGFENAFYDFIFPFLARLGQLWMAGSIHPAYEHFASNLIRQKLIVSTDALTRKNSNLRRKYLLFLPEDESHELGLLFANYLIRSRGHRSIFIGQNTPLEDIEMVSQKFQPDFLFCSITVGQLPLPIEAYCESLNEKFPGARLILTGRYAVNNKIKIAKPALLIESLEQFLNFLNR